MGAIPSMLLMIAAAGVTYGWQPDANGDRATDVEYIVQISPVEWERMRSSNSGDSSGITSVIDPAVRGQVSRIVLRVGTGDVPRKTLDSATDRRIATLKPDPQGFGLPSSLQESAGNAASDFTNQAVDRAGRAIDRTLDRVADQATNQANQGVSNLSDWMRGNQQGAAADRTRVPPPSTRPAPNSVSGTRPTPGNDARAGSGLQSNTAGNSRGRPLANRSSQSDTRLATPFAGTRTGGPSTTPSNAASVTGRDNRWADFAARQAANDSRPGMQRSSSQGSGNASRQNANSNASLASNGLRPSDTFGKMPRGLESFGANTNTFADRSDRDALNSAANNRGFSQTDQVNQDARLRNGNAGSNRNSSGNSFGINTSGQTASRRNPNLTAAQVAAGGWDFDVNDRLIDRNGQLVRSDPQGPTSFDRNGPRFTDAASNAYQSSGRYQRSSDPSRSDVDSYQRYAGQDRLDQQSAGRLRDDRDRDPRYRDSRLSNSRSSNLGNRDFDYPNDRSTYDDARAADRYATDNRSPRYASRETNDRRSVTYRADPERAEMTATNTAPRSTGEDYLDGRPRRTDSAAVTIAAGRNVQAGMGGVESMSTIPYVKPKQVAAQPLFNGLLLISIVANLYLIFWLKNLRVQFKDMVAAKRLSSSTASVA